MLTSLMPPAILADIDGGNEAANDSPTAMFGTPELGSGDPLWFKTPEYPIDKSNAPSVDKPHATGTVRILWDYDYVYARVVVHDTDLYQGPGANHTFDSLEFFVGPGSNGSNQWRVSASGVFSGQSHPDRVAWHEPTDDGYIVEIRIPKRDLELKPGKFTFEVYINNSTKQGGDRYEVVSAFGDPDTGYTSDAAFRDVLELVEAAEDDPRYSITLSTGTGGRITPNPVGNVKRVDPGSDVTFTVIPDRGKVADTVTVDGVPIEINSDNTFTLTNIRANHKIHVTFKDDPNADQYPFIVWNDNFARGEYTTAIIIDLGEGKEASGSELHPDMFTVTGRHTSIADNQVVFEGTRKITRVYANNEPKVRGYAGQVFNSPDYQEGLESGRYIVIELEFYTEGGGSITLDKDSNSTVQHYNVAQTDDIVLTEGQPITHAVFYQTGVVNPILDKFTAHSEGSFHYALYIHKDENGEEVKGLPLYVYIHGMSRGGTKANIDQKASMKSANGSVALMKRMEQDPDKYASHILNISYIGTSTPPIGDVKRKIDELIASGLADANRIYVSGFSWGGMYTNNLVNTYPDFFAAAAPLAPVSGLSNTIDEEAVRDLAYWMFVNAYNTGVYQTNLNNFVNRLMPNMTNARASRFDSNEALTWPYNQFNQPNQRPNPDLPDYIAHEIEAAVLYNQFTMENPLNGKIWSMAPNYQSPNLPPWNNDYTDIFDWMFSQRRPGVPDVPRDFTATADDGRVTLKWAAPAHNGGKEVLGYKIWYGDEEPVTVDKSTYEYTFTGLTNNQEYTFKIAAFNEIGDSAEASVKATPRSGGYTPPVIVNPDDPGDSATEDTDTESDEPLPPLPYTLLTPEDQPAVTDENGNITLPGGGVIVTGNGTKIQLPAGSTIDAGGKITAGPEGATVSLNSGLTFNIRKGAELVPDDEAALGFTVVSGNPFNDVNEKAWYYTSVNLAYTFGLFDGTSSATFAPESAMTRAMFVQVLANLENIDRTKYTKSRFSDVADGQWYTAAVEWAAENGIVKGISESLFDPHAPLTREQMAVILYNYLKYKGYQIAPNQIQSFADESAISAWALEAVRGLHGIGIVTGKGNNMFDPKGIASRAEAATVFVRLIACLAK